jgi:hypothetical protein
MNVELILKDIAKLLNEHGKASWANAFSRLAEEYVDSPEQAVRSIRSLYGGMGSFNDIVVYGSDGVPLGEENSELDRLRKQLYHVCHS